MTKLKNMLSFILKVLKAYVVCVDFLCDCLVELYCLVRLILSWFKRYSLLNKLIFFFSEFIIFVFFHLYFLFFYKLKFTFYIVVYFVKFLYLLFVCFSDILKIFGRYKASSFLLDLVEDLYALFAELYVYCLPYAMITSCELLIFIFYAVYVYVASAIWDFVEFYILIDLKRVLLPENWVYRAWDHFRFFYNRTLPIFKSFFYWFRLVSLVHIRTSRWKYRDFGYLRYIGDLEVYILKFYIYARIIYLSVFIKLLKYILNYFCNKIYRLCYRLLRLLKLILRWLTWIFVFIINIFVVLGRIFFLFRWISLFLTYIFILFYGLYRAFLSVKLWIAMRSYVYVAKELRLYFNVVFHFFVYLYYFVVFLFSNRDLVKCVLEIFFIKFVIFFYFQFKIYVLLKFCKLMSIFDYLFTKLFKSLQKRFQRFIFKCRLSYWSKKKRWRVFIGRS